MFTSQHPANSPSITSTRQQDRLRIAALLAAAVLGVAAPSATSFADKTKADNANTLNLGTSWVGGTAPGPADLAIFNNTLQSNFAFALGDNLQSWLGIRVVDPANVITFNSGNTLTLGAGGIDLSAATQSLILNNNLSLSASQPWATSSAGALTVAGVISGAGGFTQSGKGTVTLTNANLNTGVNTVNDGVLLLDFTAAGAPANNILNPAGTLALAGQLTISGTAPVQSLANLNLLTGPAKISINGGTLNLNSITKNGQPLSGGQGATLGMDLNAGAGTILWGGIGGDFSARSIITDNNGNAFATVTPNDWAATDSTGKVIAATYTAPATGSNITTLGNIEFPAGVPGQVNVNTGTITSVRFNTTTGFATLNINGGQTSTIGGFLMTGTSLVSVFVGGSTGIIRPLITTGSGGAYMNFINNNANLSNMDVFPIIADNGTNPTYVVKSGLGRVRLFGTQNSFTGQVIINEGTLTINDNRILGPAALGNSVILNGGVLQVNANVTLSNGSANARGIVITAAGGGIDPTDGFGAQSTLTVPGIISGPGRLTKLNGGSLVLSSATGNTYSGGTTITAGSIVVSNTSGSALGTGPVTINGGILRGTGPVPNTISIPSGTLTGTSTYSGLVDVGPTGHLAPGSAGVGTITTNALTFESGASFDLEFALTGGNDIVSMLNNAPLTLANPTNVNLFVAGGTTSFAANGTYAIATNVTNLVGGTATLSNLFVSPSGSAAYGFSLSGSNLVLTISGGVALSNWKTNGGGSWGDAANWTAAIPTASGDIALFGAAFAGPGTATVNLNGNRTVGTLIFNNTAGSYLLAPGSGGELTIENNGNDAAVTVTGSHTISAVTHFNASNVNFTTSNSSSSVVFTNTIDGFANVNVSGAGAFIIASTCSISTLTILAGGTVQIGNGGTTGNLSGTALVLSGTLRFNRSDVVTYGDFLSGTGGLSQAGSGTLIITQAMANTGTNSVTNGVLQIGPFAALGTGPFTATAGKLDLNGNNATLGTLSGAAGIIDNSSGGSITLAINETANSTFSGAIKNSTGTLSLVKGGASVLLLNGSSTFTGPVTILAGAITAASNGALAGAPEIDVNATTGIRLGTGTTLAVPLKLGVGAAEFIDVPGAVNATLSGNVSIVDPSVNAAIQYRLGIAGTGILTLTGTHTIPAAVNGGATPMTTFLTRGNLVFASSGQLLSAVPIQIGRNNGGTANVTIQDSAKFIAQNATPLAEAMNMGGDASTNNNTAITFSIAGSAIANVGRDDVGNHDGVGVFNLDHAGTLTTTTTLNLNGGSIILSGFIKTTAGPSTINFNGGAIVAGAANTSFLSTSANGTANALSGFVLAGGALLNTNAHDITIALPLLHGPALGATPDGGLTKTGAGVLTLTGVPATIGTTVSQYTGTTTISQGTVLFSGSVAHSVGPVTGAGTLQVASGTSLTTGNVSVANWTINGTHAIRANTSLTGRTSTATSLILSGATNAWTSKLDLANNNLIVPAAGGGANVANQIKQQANLGAWNGTGGGITSTSALAAATSSTATALGFASGTQFTANNGQTRFDSLAFNPTDTLVMYTLAGDANMDGSVTFADFLQLQNHYNQAGTDWEGGDWNYDGSTTFADFLILQNNYNKALSVSSVVSAGAGAVPEPGTLAVLTLAATLLVQRRGKKRL